MDQSVWRKNYKQNARKWIYSIQNKAKHQKKPIKLFKQIKLEDLSRYEIKEQTNMYISESKFNFYLPNKLRCAYFSIKFVDYIETVASVWFLTFNVKKTIIIEKSTKTR